MIFISYRRVTGITLSQLVTQSLRHLGYEVFLDIDTIHNGRWTTQIEEALNSCTDYILIIANNSDLDYRSEQEEDWYYKEIKLAEELGKNIIILAAEDIILEREFPSGAEYLKQIEAIWYDPKYYDSVLSKLIDFIKCPAVKAERVENKYDTVRFEARKRLADQQLLFREANDAVYDRLLQDKEHFNILDLGCNDGEFAGLHFLNRDGCDRVIGIDVSEKIFAEMIEHPSFSAFLLDCEADDFIKRLRDIMSSFGIKHFDLINISFLLLHLKNPHNLLYRIRELLAPDGYVFIRDIDDTQTFAYPDKDDCIKRLKEIKNYCLHTGNRNTGGRIYTSLVDSGYSNISLIPEVFSTAGASKSQRKRLFYVNYSFVEENVQDMVNMNPSVKKYNDDYEWVKNNIEKVEHLFSHREFFYKMGAVAFTAQYSDEE